MNKPQDKNQPVEEQLADFTDKILNEKSGKTPFATDTELHELEKTALRLKKAFRDEYSSEVAVQRIRKDIVAHLQQQEKKKKSPFWMNWIPVNQKWRSQRSRQRFRLTVSLITLSIVLFAGLYLLKGTGTNQPAASGQVLNSYAMFILGGLILLVIWISLRKR